MLYRIIISFFLVLIGGISNAQVDGFSIEPDTVDTSESTTTSVDATSLTTVDVGVVAAVWLDVLIL